MEEEKKDSNEERNLQDWADRLGMDYDPEKCKTPPPMPENVAPQRETPPMYVMQPGSMPPPEMNPMADPHLNRPMPPTYLVWAIIATLCCCLPAGVVAIVFSSSVSSKYFARDYEGAQRASRNAQIWIIISIVLGIIVNTVYLPLSLLMEI